jgi:succinylglutamate desuccinylase
LKSSVTPGGSPASNDGAGEMSNELTESHAHKRLRVDLHWRTTAAKLARFAPTREAEKDENPQNLRWLVAAPAEKEAKFARFGPTGQAAKDENRRDFRSRTQRASKANSKLAKCHRLAEQQNVKIGEIFAGSVRSPA